MSTHEQIEWMEFKKIVQLFVFFINTSEYLILQWENHM